MFSLGPQVAKVLGNRTLPLSGFRVRTLLNSRSVWDEFLVFQGASYFRAVATGGAYGLSARGLAMRTAHPTGEEFPAFTHFWIERPGANASGIVVHALLDSPSTTGAYRFSITPGAETIMDVDMTLFPRVALDNVGLAPLTSMFLFDESERTRIDDFRDEVHDSDGLQIVTGVGRARLASAAQSDATAGLELSRRRAARRSAWCSARAASDYHDLEAQYEMRPSAWIEPTSDWGEGSVQLIEIPTESETNDNIVAFWRPSTSIPGRQAVACVLSHALECAAARYCLRSGRAMSTRTGPSLDGKRSIFVVDFDGAGATTEGLEDRRGHVGRQAVATSCCNRIRSPKACARASSSLPASRGGRAAFAPAARRIARH